MDCACAILFRSPLAASKPQLRDTNLTKMIENKCQDIVHGGIGTTDKDLINVAAEILANRARFVLTDNDHAN